ncbi:putative hydrolase or acyltransferase of alpha/beta superfamily [Leptolyngbya sp. PCC 7375]|nr:putative hydrolase or acyltransferase of alpha/beta superfamily [Leptolyngbya sp. PCC 7375]
MDNGKVRQQTFCTFPDFCLMATTLPADVQHLTEDTSVALASQIQFADISTNLTESPIATSYMCAGTGKPILLIHGFDSSIFEFRRLVPQLSANAQVWVMDLLGFGFTDRTTDAPITPIAIQQHIYSFWQQQIGQPMILAGASMGGAAAIDFTLNFPEAVEKLVLLDSAGFAAGPAMGKFMVPPLDSWATTFLRNPGVRRRISQQAYYDRTFVTPDAELCAALHLQMPNWKEALIAFTKSGGYNFLTNYIQKIEPPTLIVWGKQDKILGTKDAQRFQQTIPNNKLVWIDDCGHVPHLEKPRNTAQAIVSFV